jgi:nucleoside-diphosphate-sugar epimerase
MQYNILVTGGAGYLGSTLVPELLRLGHKVTVVDSFIFGQNSLLEACSNENFTVVRADARREDVMKPLLAKADVIIPLAALVGAPLCGRDEVGTITTNRDAIELITKHTSKEQRLIYPNTNSGYGIGEKGIFCTEESPLRPLSLYGRIKVESEKIVHERGNAVSFRFATVFGASPRMRIDLLVNDFAYRAVKDRFVVVFEGHFKRNYIHVRDVTNAFVHVIDNYDSMAEQAYNVGMSDANLSKLELCAKIQEQLPEFVVLESQIGEDPDKRDYIVSNDKIEATGFKPKHTLEGGIKELIKVYTMLSNTKYTNV